MNSKPAKKATKVALGLIGTSFVLAVCRFIPAFAPVNFYLIIASGVTAAIGGGLATTALCFPDVFDVVNFASDEERQLLDAKKHGEYSQVEIKESISPPLIEMCVLSKSTHHQKMEKKAQEELAWSELANQIIADKGELELTVMQLIQTSDKDVEANNHLYQQIQNKMPSVSELRQSKSHEVQMALYQAEQQGDLKAKLLEMLNGAPKYPNEDDLNSDTLKLFIEDTKKYMSQLDACANTYLEKTQAFLQQETQQRIGVQSNGVMV